MRRTLLYCKAGYRVRLGIASLFLRSLLHCWRGRDYWLELAFGLGIGGLRLGSILLALVDINTRSCTVERYYCLPIPHTSVWLPNFRSGQR
jgi:hypothetical protein